MNRFTVFIILLLISSVTGAEGTTPYTAVKNAKGVQEIVMTAKSYSFSPDRVIVQVGVAVELKIKKSGWTPHTFIIDDPASGLDIKEKLSSSKDTLIKFTPEQKGEFAFYCGKKLPFGKSHREKGMHGLLGVR
ncbi:MAG: cupredoxin domain-containing protein [Proteobacteria bacterium]|nr:MAG: cupredoxin domain-containing protein [Pseudomonadota bacterium]